MTWIALLILAAVVVAALLRPRTPAQPIVIYVDRAPAEESTGGCLPTAMALVAIAVLIILLAG